MPSASKKVAEKQNVSQVISYNPKVANVRRANVKLTSIIGLNSAAIQNTVGVEIDLAATIGKGVGDNITKLREVGSDIYVAGGEGAVNRCGIDNIGK